MYKGKRKFNLNKVIPEWTRPFTGEIIDSMAKLTLTDNYVSIEGIFSKNQDLLAAGYTQSQIDEDKQPDAIAVGGKRGEITDFTRASQSRFIKSVSLWNPLGRLIMLTLTYAYTWPSSEEVQRHFKNFRTRMNREKPDWAGCWKLEYQKRGAPHFHLVIDTMAPLKNIRPLRKWVKETWDAVRQDGEPARVQCEFARNPHRAKYYLTKEIGKTVQASKAWRESIEAQIDHSGRFWGWINKKNLNRTGNQYYIPAEYGLKIREAIQNLSVKEMQKRGIIKTVDGKPIFTRNGVECKPELLVTWKLSQYIKYQFDRILKEIENETGKSFDDYAVLIPPPPSEMRANSPP